MRMQGILLTDLQIHQLNLHKQVHRLTLKIKVTPIRDLIQVLVSDFILTLVQTRLIQLQLLKLEHKIILQIMCKAGRMRVPQQHLMP